MLSRLVFGSFLAYLPPGRGGGELARQSQNVTYALKQDLAYGNSGRTMSQEIARRLEEAVPGSVLERILRPEALLVPVPRSGLLRKGDLWPSLRIAEALRACGFGTSVAPLVVRSYGVRSSATAPGTHRLWPDQHYDSMQIDRALVEPPRAIVLVDDVVTRGATILGAAARLAETFPEVEILGFAVVRTVKPGSPLERIREPCVGVIDWRPGWIERDP